MPESGFGAGPRIEATRLGRERTQLRFFEKDLRIKLTAIFLLLVLFALAASVFISLAFINNIIRHNVEESMLDSARMARNLLDVSLEQRSTRMQLLASYPVMRDPYSDPASKQALLSLFVEAWPIGKDAVFVDTGGNVVCGTGRLGAIGNVTGTSWFKNAQTARISYTFIQQSGELTSIFFDSPVLAVSAPVRDANEQIFGYVVTFTTLSDIRRAIDGVKIEKTGHGFLVDRAGEVIAGHLVTTAQKATPEDKRKLDDLIDQMTRGEAGTATLTYYDEKYLVTYAPVEQSSTLHPELDWAVGVVVPNSEAFAPVGQVAWALTLMAVIILAGSVVASVLLGRSITRPINELVASAEKMGSGDLTSEVVISTRDQIGSLAAALLRMRDYLRGALGEAAYTSDKMSMLAEEQSAATGDVFTNTEDIVNSVIVLAKNMETQTQKVRKLSEFTERMPSRILESQDFEQVRELLRDSEILAEVGASKAVEIATATQDQRAAARDVAAAARRLSDIARELKDMVRRFKV